MKKIYIVFGIILSLFLVGCDNNTKVGEGLNIDVSNTKSAQVLKDPVELEKAYGKVLHHGVKAKSVSIGGVNMSAYVSAINFIVKDSGELMVLSFVCDSRAGQWGLSHNLTVNGEEPAGVTEISIMNYNKDVTDIREADENNPVFSTADGDSNIGEGLKRIAELNPESNVAIVLDSEGEDGLYEGKAWSYLLNVGDVIKELRTVNLGNCLKTPNQQDTPPEIMYVSTMDIKEMAKQKHTL